MTLKEELDKLNITLSYSLSSKSRNEYYIIINKDNIETKYLKPILDIEYTCSYIGTLLINKVSTSIIKNKFKLIKTTNTINSIINKPKLDRLKKTYLLPKHSYFPKDRLELINLVYKLIDIRGNNCSLNDIDVSKINDMSYLFRYSHFNGDISKWDISKVEDMRYMFYYSKFNGDISKWDVSNATKMESMDYVFCNSPLENNKPFGVSKTLSLI